MEISIRIADLKRGTYILKLQSEKYQVNKTFIKS